jgi:hypothetical protein
MVIKFLGFIGKENKDSACLNMKTLTNFKDSSESFVRISVLGLPFLPLVDFCHCPLLIGCRKNPRKCTCHWRLSETFSGSQTAFGTGYVNKVSGKMFRINQSYNSS